MVKVCIFNKSNRVSRFDIFRKFFECVNHRLLKIDLQLHLRSGTTCYTVVT